MIQVWMGLKDGRLDQRYIASVLTQVRGMTKIMKRPREKSQMAAIANARTM